MWPQMTGRVSASLIAAQSGWDASCRMTRTVAAAERLCPPEREVDALLLDKPAGQPVVVLSEEREDPGVLVAEPDGEQQALVRRIGETGGGGGMRTLQEDGVVGRDATVDLLRQR